MVTNPGTEQPAENRDIQMTMNASPAPALEVIPAEFLLHLAEAGFHLPPPKGHAEQVAERPATLSRNAVAEEVFCLAGQHVAGDDQRPLAADQPRPVCLSPTGVPLDFPDFRTVTSVLDAILLRLLFGEARRVSSQVLNFTGARVAASQARIVGGASRSGFRRVSQDPGLREPGVKVRRHLSHVGLAAIVEPVQKLAVAPIGFVKSPGLDADAVGERAID